jgi:hypothetical protein
MSVDGPMNSILRAQNEASRNAGRFSTQDVRLRAASHRHIGCGYVRRVSGSPTRARLRVLAPRVFLPTLIVEPPVALPHVRTVRGHCQESGHQNTAYEQDADCESAEDDQHKT